MTEKWKAIPGYVGTYEVSDLGRVRGLRRIDGQGRDWPARVLKQKTHRGGHRTVNLWLNAMTTRFFVHRLVLSAFVGPCPEDMEGCHNNGHAADNRLGNLRWDTHRENVLDMTRHGTNAGSAKTVCIRGHRLAPPNLATSAARRGIRKCRACDRGWATSKRLGIEVQIAADQHYEQIMERAA